MTNLPCCGPDCDRDALTIEASNDIDKPWLYEFCSRDCWETVDILQHLRAEGEELTDIAADEIEARDKRIANMEQIIDRLIEAFGLDAVHEVLKK